MAGASITTTTTRTLSFAEWTSTWRNLTLGVVGVLNTGGPASEVAATHALLMDQVILTPAVLVIIAVALFFAFRCLLGVALVLTTVAVSILWTAGIFSVLGRPVDIVASIIPTTLLVYGVVDPIFVLTRYLSKAEVIRDREQAVVEALGEMLLPCFLTSLTTALGFAVRPSRRAVAAFRPALGSSPGLRSLCDGRGDSRSRTPGGRRRWRESRHEAARSRSLGPAWRGPWLCARGDRQRRGSRQATGRTRRGLAGTLPVLGMLRQQLSGAHVRSREFSGTGFFIEFDVPADLEPVSTKQKRIHFGDVVAKLPELKHGAGFVLFVRDGKLEMLAGYSYDEPWPERVSQFELAYTDASRQQALRVLA